MKRLLLLTLFAAILQVLAANSVLAGQVKFGSLLALSGDLGAYGPPIDNGGQMAKDDLNRAGELRGLEVLRRVHRDRDIHNGGHIVY